MNADDPPQPADPSPPQDAPQDAPPPEGATSPGSTPLARLLPAAIAAVVLALCLGLLLGRWSAPAPRPLATPAPEAAPTVWTCSMHPQIRAAEPGACPVCGMDLIPLTSAGDDLGPRELRLSPAAAALAEVETTPVQRRRVSRELRLVGKVDFDESRFDYITAWVPGRLDRLYVDTTGTLVREGDHLVELYSPQLLSAQEELLQALEAQRSLAEGGGSELLTRSSARTVESAREKLRLWGLGRDQIAEVERTGRTSDHVTIRAPVGGVVIHKNKNPGDYVQTGERVYTIADLSQVWVVLEAYEQDLAFVRFGQTVRFETEAYPGETFAGRVVFIDPVLSGSTRTVKVRLNVENAQRRLKPGMFVRAVLEASLEAEGQTLDPSLFGTWICPMHWEEIAPGPGACAQCGMPLVPAESLHPRGDPQAQPPLVVPASAVLWTGVRSLVYVRVPGEEPVFRGQEVVLGPRAGDVYVVREGLEEGQEVVTRGAFKLDSALQIEARPAMMLPEDRGPTRHAAPASLLAALDPVFAAYLDLQRGLAGDDLAATQAAARALAAAVQGVDPDALQGEALAAWLGLARRLRDDAASVAAAPDLEAARVDFEALAQAALELERGFGHRSGELQEAFCPMAFENRGARWLQAEDGVLNPYFGARMLTCGEVTERFPPRADPAAAGFAAELAPLVRVYLELAEELAQDAATGQARAAELRAALDAVDAQSLSAQARATWEDARLPALQGALEALAAASDLAAQRAAFEALSQALIQVVTAHGAPPGVEVRRFHCPMAFGHGADWLQTAADTRNPFYGSRMFDCGSEVELGGPR